MITAITGFMMSGKTLAGRDLASRLCCQFIDLDGYIEEKEGADAASIILSKGESRFRTIEKKCLEELLSSGIGTAEDDNLVLSLGGGTLMDPDNLSLVKKHCTLVWLRTTVEETLAFLADERNAVFTESRPLLKTSEVQKLFAERLPGYLSADLTVDAGALTPQEIAERISDYLVVTGFDVAETKLD